MMDLKITFIVGLAGLLAGIFVDRYLLKFILAKRNLAISIDQILLKNHLSTLRAKSDSLKALINEIETCSDDLCAKLAFTDNIEA